MENVIYYLFLFLLVIIIRFFKLKNTYKQDFKYKWKEVMFISLEIVYTASGIVIALLLNVEKNWIASVVMIYLVIVIFSAQLDMSNENLSTNVKTILHSIIILIVLVGTYMTYNKVIPKVDINGNTNKVLQDTVLTKNYTIIIPYNDYSLSKHIGASKLKNKPFFFKISINAKNKDSLYFKATSIITKEKLIIPVFQSDRDNDIEFLRNEVVIFENNK